MRSHWICAFLLVVAASARARAETALMHVDVFVSGKNGYHTYRIPAIETAPDGSLLAFAEARKYNAGDPGMENNEIDLVCKRSTDGGRTWSAMKVIEAPGQRWSAANPATVVDRQTGRVWLLYLRCKPGRNTDTSRPGTDDNQILARTSDDSGLTWSSPIDLTAVSRDMEDPRWRVSVVGPGGMIQDRKGRLMAPVWRAAPGGVLAIFSEDHGRTWHRGQAVPGGQGGDEDQLVELSDGRILIDYRQSGGPQRWMAESPDGGRTWSEPRPGLPVSPVCCAIERFTLKSAGDDRDRILWTGPKGPGRNNLVVRVSYDECRTFPNERLIAAGPAAYSDLAILKDKSAGVLWERGGYRFITFTRLTREFLEPVPAAGAIYSCTFTPGHWDRVDWMPVKVPQGEHFGDWVQEDKCIANQVPEGVTPEELEGKRAAEACSSMVYKEKVRGNVTIVSTMAFAHKMAPLVLLAADLSENAKGQKECSERFEVVIFNEGVNVWRHWLKDGKLTYRKAAYARFPLEKETPYRLEVKKAGKTLTVSVAGHTFGYTDDALPDACYVGIMGCEGLNRFYDFKVQR